MTALDCAPLLDLARWHRAASHDELRLLAGIEGPALDIGCGPGRVVEALLERGVPALGIDAAPTAIAIARSRGLHVMTRSVFDRMPREGEWVTVLLLDGNIGIGGDPERLLTRVHDVLRPGGRVLVEVEPPGTPTRHGLVRLEVATEMVGWFPWSWVGAADIGDLARAAGFAVESRAKLGERVFTWLRRPVAAAVPAQTRAFPPRN
jgi:SAM-dependent methyltransferase